MLLSSSNIHARSRRAPERSIAAGRAYILSHRDKNVRSRLGMEVAHSVELCVKRRAAHAGSIPDQIRWRTLPLNQCVALLEPDDQSSGIEPTPIQS
jgi:hypothetical protein